MFWRRKASTRGRFKRCEKLMLRIAASITPPALTPDEAVDRLIIAGTPAQCRSRIAELFSLAARDGFTQITLGVPLGPDIPEVIDLWGKEILPALR